LAIALIAIASFGCTTRAEQEVVVYAALDREFSEPILRDFERETGIHVRAKYDIESTKTVGLVTEIIQEQNRPRCDLFWNNEMLHTLRLGKLGLLRAYDSPRGADLPADYRAADNTWYGIAARARVLLVNTELVPADEMPDSVDDLLDERWQGKVGLAKPLFGTTATHAAVLFARLGDEEARKFFDRLHANAKVLGGNKQVAQAVSRGEIAFGLTDTDDAMGEIDAGSPVAIVYPDRGADQLGTLFIPNTLAMLKGAPHPKAARALADAIFSPEVEDRLADGPSAQIPLLKGSKRPARVETPATVHAMPADFEAATDAWDRTAAFLAQEFAD
jgi:iron(III) transport system substrate-binding protein